MIMESSRIDELSMNIEVVDEEEESISFLEKQTFVDQVLKSIYIYMERLFNQDIKSQGCHTFLKGCTEPLNLKYIIDCP
jgi:hypothetical protein